MPKSRGTNKTEYTIDDAPSVAQINFKKMRLLTMVPEFQKDVRIVRQEFGIPSGGFETEKEADQWLDKNSFHFASPWPFPTKPPANPFRDRLAAIGEKFKLPYHFYRSSLYGIASYILMNKISVPENNWEIDYDFNDGSGIPRWVSIRAYAPLTDKEIRDAVKELRKTQRRSMPKGIASPKRRYRTFYRDITLVEQLLARSGKPKKVKRYTGYLEMIQGQVSEKKMRELEKLHTGCIVVEYDQPTTKELVKSKKGVKPATIRTAKKRLNKLAKELFGYGLWP